MNKQSKKLQGSVVCLIEYIAAQNTFCAAYVNGQVIESSNDYEDEESAFFNVEKSAENLSNALKSPCFFYSICDADFLGINEAVFVSTFSEDCELGRVDTGLLFDITVRNFSPRSVNPGSISYVEYFPSLHAENPYAAVYVDDILVNSTYYYEVENMRDPEAAIAHEQIKKYAESLAIGTGLPYRVSRFNSQDVFERADPSHNTFAQFFKVCMDTQDSPDDDLLAVAEDIGFFPDEQLSSYCGMEDGGTSLATQQDIEDALRESNFASRWLIWTYDDLKNALKQRHIEPSVVNMITVGQGLSDFGSSEGIKSSILGSIINKSFNLS
jgi:hypothetical protein